MTLGLFLMVAGVALLWSGLKNKDLREAIPLILTNKDPSNASAISDPLPDDTPIQGFSDTTTAQNLGESTKWTKARVFIYGQMIAKAFKVRIGGQCRKDGVVPPFGSKTSLHFESNGCRALDIFGTDAKLKKLEKWAKAQGVFAEVLYTGVAGHGPGMGGTRHLHLGFKTSSKVPILPGSQSGGGGGGGSF